CPGINFAMAIIEIALANLLYRFNWELPHGLNPVDLDMSEAPGLTTPKKIPLRLISTCSRAAAAPTDIADAAAALVPLLGNGRSPTLYSPPPSPSTSNRFENSFSWYPLSFPLPFSILLRPSLAGEDALPWGGIAGRQMHQRRWPAMGTASVIRFCGRCHSSNFLSLRHLFSPIVKTNGNKAYVIDTLALVFVFMSVRRLEAQQVPSKQVEAITSVITIVLRMLPGPRLEVGDAEGLGFDGRRCLFSRHWFECADTVVLMFLTELRGVDEVRLIRVVLESRKERHRRGEKLEEGRPYKRMTRSRAHRRPPTLMRLAPVGDGGTSQGALSGRRCYVGNVGWYGSV
ncbi:hypothetical protein GW17_00041430, partial [Ensete ventricosum]